MLSLARNYVYGMFAQHDLSFRKTKLPTCHSVKISGRNFIRNRTPMKDKIQFSVQRLGAIIRFPVALRLHGMTVSRGVLRFACMG